MSTRSSTTRAPSRPGGEDVFVPAKKSPPKKRRWGWWVVAVALILPVVYLSAQILAIFAPQLQTATAIRASMDEYIEAAGIAALDSVPITGGQAAAALHYTVSPGSRVAQGETVAELYPSDAALQACLALAAINDEIAHLEAAQRIAVEGGDVEVFLKQRQQGINSWLAAVEAGDYASLSAAKADIALASNKVQIVTGGETDFEARLGALRTQRDGLAAVAVPSGSIAAPVAGYFVPSSRYDRLMMGHDALSAFSADALQAQIDAEAEYYPTDIVGHIVTSYRWYFTAPITAGDAARLYTGKIVSLSFPDYGGETVPATVTALQESETGAAVRVEFMCEYINSLVVKLRTEQAKIILRSEEGMRIDKRALRIVDGHNGVYVKLGNTVLFKRITILLEDEFYYLVKDSGQPADGWIQMYDEVIVDAGGMELHDGKTL